MKKSLIAMSLMILLAHHVAWADIYKCADDTGQVAFADAKTKSNYNSCKLIMRDESTPSTSKPNTNTASNNPRTATPADFPKVDRQTQTVRDDKRKQILLSELESEQKALLEAKKTYSESTAQASLNNVKMDDKTQRLQADVDAHEKNIQLIQKELMVLR